jgi:ribosome biogenesis GTPase / thiamine phosphate phosphatase
MNFEDQLFALGWNEFFATRFQQYAEGDYEVGRVALEHKNFYRLYTARGEVIGEISGKLRHEAMQRAELPAVGDWVVIRLRSEGDKAMIHAVLPRKSCFVRKAAGSKTEEQVVGANIDTVFLVTSLNHDFNLRRIERYLAVAWESGARPIVILTKADLCDEVEARLDEAGSIAFGVPVHAVSVVLPDALEELQQYFKPGETIALLGSSGVGKSTLVNHLLGCESMRVQEVREHDDRGRHTTTHRELIVLPRGGLVLDTPGMRELQLWDGADGLERTFDDIEAFAARCYFGDCRHQEEPQCAVREALDEGLIDEERYLSYEKLRKELAHLIRKQDVRVRLAEKQRWKKLSRLATQRAHSKRR